MLDTALWLDVVAGGSKEPEAPPPPERPFVESARTAPGKLRVAWSTAAPRALLRRRRSPTRSRRRSPTPPRCSARSATTSPSKDPDWGRIGDNISARFLHGVAETVDEVPHPERLERRTRGFGRLGKVLPDGLFERAMRPGREADRARVNAIFDSHDVLLMPTMGGTALPVRRWEGRGALRTVLGMSRFYPFCVPWNHLGNPAMAVPFGFGADGMPLSIQVIGRHGDEATLLSLAAQIEAERPWADRIPQLP